MKISGWIGIVCLSLCNFSLSATMNLMENGSFEQGLKGWRIDKIGNPDAEAVLVKDMASDGKQSLNITFKGNRKSNVYITVWKSLKLQPLTKYRLRFQAKAQNSRSFWAGIEYQPLVRSKGGTADWQEYLFEFTTKSNSQVHFRFLVEEQAENIWLDNVVLEKVVKNSSSSPVEQSILAFGAKPDGSSDSTAAFQKAVEAGVSRIFIPEGVFAVKELVLPDNISITGCGENSCLIPFSEDQKFVIRGGNNARFSDFAVDCRGRKTQGLFFFRTGNVMIERVFVSNSGTFGINLDHVVDAVIRDCVIRATHTGIMQTYCSNLRTVRNTVLDSTKHGIQFWSQDHWRPQFRTRNLWFCDNFVKNDCNLNVRPIALLTGPNMAGKSTYLRQNALLVVLAHIGAFVPATRATIGICDQLFSRVGASDNLAAGQSTFMVEMSETANILRRATHSSFIIFDEIGRGTATYDGMAIAQAVLEYQDKLGARVLFATHYHELTGLVGDTDDKLRNVSCLTIDVQEHNNEIIFMHKIVAGVANRSYGIQVAKMAGMPESVVHRAENVLSELESQRCNVTVVDVAPPTPTKPDKTNKTSVAQPDKHNVQLNLFG